MDSLPVIFVEAVHKHLNSFWLDENLQHLSSYWGQPKTPDIYKSLSPLLSSFLHKIPQISRVIHSYRRNNTPEIIPYVIKAIELGTLMSLELITRVSDELASAVSQWILCRNFCHLKIAILRGSPVSAEDLFEAIYEHMHELEQMAKKDPKRRIEMFS